MPENRELLPYHVLDGPLAFIAEFVLELEPGRPDLANIIK